MTGWCKPPDNIEFFLSALFASAKQNGGRPALFDAAFLITRYRSEYAMLELPAFGTHASSFRFSTSLDGCSESTKNTGMRRNRCGLRDRSWDRRREAGRSSC